MADMKPIEALQEMQTVLGACKLTWAEHLRLQQAAHVLRALIEATTQAEASPADSQSSPPADT